jgi:hypothetical protein
MTEKWKPVAGYEGRYEVSTEGAVWSLIRQRLMTPVLLRNGYLAVGLRLSGNRRRTHTVHTLVAQTFLPTRPTSRHEVCHFDGDKLNNSVANLRWGTRSENMHDSVRHGTHPMSRKTHCKRGHEFTLENTQPTGPTGSGYRRCRTCQRDAQRAYDSRKRISA